LRAFRLGLVALAAALGGSALGAALLTAPLLFGGLGDDGFPVRAVFIVALPFALAGTAVLTGLSLLWRDSLSRRYGDYGGILLVSAPIGGLIALPFLGLFGFLFGAMFGPLVAAVWALLYSRFALPPGMRELSHG
jgi:hypothetical protein